jgi:uncharacterized membrane protein
MSADSGLQQENRRLMPVDAVRGAAMVFVGVSHVSFYVQPFSPHMAAVLRWLGFFATPNFLLMSGLAAGYQLAARPGAALRILDRGLFVLLIGHVLVSASLVYMSLPGTTFEHVVITDTIGLMLCTSPLLRDLHVRTLLPAGAVLFCVSSAIAFLWHPATGAGTVAGGALFDIKSTIYPGAGWITATLPYYGLFLIGIGIGKLIYGRRREGRALEVARTLAIAGGLAILTGVCLNVTAHFLKAHPLQAYGPPDIMQAVLDSGNIRRKNPPSLAYALFYGGLGITLVGLLGFLAGREQSRFATPMRLAAVFGRASFVTYVAQQWLIDFVPLWIGFETWLMPAASLTYLLLVIAATFFIARAWDRRQANQYLTLGLRFMAEPPPLRQASLTS